MSALTIVIVVMTKKTFCHINFTHRIHLKMNMTYGSRKSQSQAFSWMRTQLWRYSRLSTFWCKQDQFQFQIAVQIGPNCLHWIALGFELISIKTIDSYRVDCEEVGGGCMIQVYIMILACRLMYLCNVWVGKGRRRGGKWELEFNTPKCYW